MKGTYMYKLSEYGKNNFQCKAMNTRVLPFAKLLAIRNEVQNPSFLITIPFLYVSTQVK